jgi:tol-pal system protein YbgF
MSAMKTLPLLGLVLALSFAAPTFAPAFGQTPMDPLDDHSAKRLDRMEQALREIRAIVFQGRETGKPVVVQPADTDSQFAALSQKLDDLQQAITRMTGQLESASHDVDQARREANELREENGALSARITALEQKLTQAQAAPAPSAPGPEATGPVAPQVAPPPPMDAAGAMAAARAAYSAGDYANAETGFRDVAQRFGNTSRGPEARYWLGKIQLQRNNYAEAASTDLAVVREWPATAWAPDAALDLARAMLGMREPRSACGVLTELDSHYPRAGADIRTGEAQLRGEAGCAQG